MDQPPTLELKSLRPDAVAGALEKAEHYRLLNEPGEAESICLDALALEPENQRALTILLLALTDQLDREGGRSLARARELLPRLQDPYTRAYHAGLLFERQAKACLRRGAPRAGEMAYQWLRQATERFAEAESLRPAGNDDAILRWNSCVRLLRSSPAIRPGEPDTGPQLLE
jgi:hypothetical protein